MTKKQELKGVLVDLNKKEEEPVEAQTSQPENEPAVEQMDSSLALSTEINADDKKALKEVDISSTVKNEEKSGLHDRSEFKIVDGEESNVDRDEGMNRSGIQKKTNEDDSNEKGKEGPESFVEVDHAMGSSKLQEPEKMGKPTSNSNISEKDKSAEEQGMASGHNDKASEHEQEAKAEGSPKASDQAMEEEHELE